MRYFKYALLALLVAAIAVAPGVASNYWTFLIATILVNAIAAQGLNVVMGYTGQVSLGHAAFVAVGAYSVALCATRLHAGILAGAALGLVLAVVMGIVVGIPSLKLNPLYLSMVTYGFGQVIVLIALNWVKATGGPNGLKVVGASMSQNNLAAYYIVLAGAVLAWWITWRLVNSAYGRALVAVRENETAAETMGIDVRKVKVVAFILSSLYGAFAGILYAYLSGFVNPDAFAFSTSISYLTMNVVGGMGTVAGPLVGAIVLTVLPQVLGPLAEYQEFIAGAILLLFLLLARGGLTASFQSVSAIGRRLGGARGAEVTR